ncbi:MAG: hypothetical protein E6G89_05720 [Alphaproteobacteria bacterium]|nr:MAG: hypothetical protein E6G89_05720 [Alphaproteobacteria bacterium]
MAPALRGLYFGNGEFCTKLSELDPAGREIILGAGTKGFSCDCTGFSRGRTGARPVLSAWGADLSGSGAAISAGLGFGNGGRVFTAASAIATAEMKQQAMTTPHNAMRFMDCPLVFGPVLLSCELRYGFQHDFPNDR